MKPIRYFLAILMLAYLFVAAPVMAFVEAHKPPPAVSLRDRPRVSQPRPCRGCEAPARPRPLRMICDGGRRPR